MSRVCRTCGLEKPATAEFFYERQRAAGPELNTQCIPCFRDARNARYRADHDHARQVARDSYHRTGVDGRRKGVATKARNRAAKPDLYAEIATRYETKHTTKRKAKRRDRHWGTKEDNNQRSRQWYHANRERAIETALAWQRAHPIEAAASRLKVRANRAKAPGTNPTIAQLRVRIQEYAWRCAYCFVNMDNAVWTTRGGRLRPLLEWDHVLALSLGGSRCIENVVPACHPCNRRKGARTVADFLGLP